MMRTYLPSLFSESLMDVFDDFDRNFFRGFDRPERVLYGKNATRMMKTDVKETDTGYEVDMDLPGFKKDEIKLELENGILTVSAQKGVDKSEEDKNGRIIRQERYSGAMQRSFYVGENVTEDQVKASFEDGVLHLQLPKAEQASIPEKKTICIE